MLKNIDNVKTKYYNKNVSVHSGCLSFLEEGESNGICVSN
jgi:hypothetical protein